MLSYTQILAKKFGFSKHDKNFIKKRRLRICFWSVGLKLATLQLFVAKTLRHKKRAERLVANNDTAPQCDWKENSRSFKESQLYFYRVTYWMVWSFRVPVKTWTENSIINNGLKKLPLPVNYENKAALHTTFLFIYVTTGRSSTHPPPKRKRRKRAF